MEIEFHNVSKYYKKHAALKQVNLNLKEGIYGLMGPNGAGKTTFMKILVGNLLQSEGTVICDGEDIREIGKRYRSYIGYMPQQQEIYPYFTGRRFLSYMAALKGIPRSMTKEKIEKAAVKTNVMEFLDRKVGGYSGGMKQRLLIAQAILGEPKLLVLDEPTAGLDPKERIRIRNLISENAKGKTVIIATHVVQDIECIADHLIMLKQGELAVQGTPEYMLSEIESQVYEIKVPLEQVDDYLNKYRVSNVTRCREGMRLRIVGDKSTEPAGDIVEPDLEDYYLHLYDTGED